MILLWQALIANWKHYEMDVSALLLEAVHGETM